MGRAAITKIGFLFFITALVFPSLGLSEYVVFMKDGRYFVSASKPVLAFGKVRFRTADGRYTVLDFSDVDLDRTREAIRDPQGAAIFLKRERERAEAVRRHGREAVMREELPPGIRTDDVFGEGEAESSGENPLIPVVYGMRGSRHTEELLDYFNERRVEYLLVNVSDLSGPERRKAIDEVRKIAGYAVFPVVRMGGTTIVGFDRGRLDRVYGNRAIIKKEHEVKEPNDELQRN